MDTEVEDLELIVDIEKIEKWLEDDEKSLSEVKDCYEDLRDRLSQINSHGTKSVTEPTLEELKKLLAPSPVDLTGLSVYDPDLPDRVSLEYQEFVPSEIRDQDLEEEVMKELEKWHLTLDESDRNIVCVNGNENGVIGNTSQQETDKWQDMLGQQHDDSDIPPMDIEFTSEMPRKVIVTPKTDLKSTRRALALRSHQSDSVKRQRRSARF